MANVVTLWSKYPGKFASDLLTACILGFVEFHDTVSTGNDVFLFSRPLWYDLILHDIELETYCYLYIDG